MKNLLILLCFFVPGAWADARIELDTSTCHAPVNGYEAHEFYCYGSALKLGDGRYNAFFEGGFITTRANLGGGVVPESALIPLVYETDCSDTPGVFLNYAGKKYTTRDCRVYLDYREWGFSIEQGRPERFRVDVVIELNGLTPAGETDWDDD